MTAPTVTIDQALGAFLVAQGERLSERSLGRYEGIVELLRDSLNGYAYNSLDPEDHARWEAAVEAGDEDAYCHLFPPDHIPGHLGEFLGCFMIRKVMAGEDLLRAAGTVTKRLAKWLRDEGLISADQAADAADRGGAAARELPRAERLGNVLYDQAQKMPGFDPADVPDEHIIEDYLAIERVEPGHSGSRAMSAQSRSRRRRAISPSRAGASTSSW